MTEQTYILYYIHRDFTKCKECSNDFIDIEVIAVSHDITKLMLIRDSNELKFRDSYYLEEVKLI